MELNFWRIRCMKYQKTVFLYFLIDVKFFIKLQLVKFSQIAAKTKKKYLAWNVIQPFKDNYAQYENDVFKSSKNNNKCNRIIVKYVTASDFTGKIRLLTLHFFLEEVAKWNMSYVKNYPNVLFLDRRKTIQIKGTWITIRWNQCLAF